MKPWKHQSELSKVIVQILKENMIAYLAWEERTGKSYTALLVAEAVDVKDVLIITKKKPLKDWKDLLKKAELTKNYFITNYHNAWKLCGNYDLIILDEAHNYLSAYPKIGATADQLAVHRKNDTYNKSIYDAVKKLCKRKPILYLSATPYAQGPQLLYHQFSLSSWSPWRNYSTFYSWFKTYGKPYTIELRGREVNQYDRCKVDKVIASCSHLFHTKTRAELNFEHEPNDVIHDIKLSNYTKEIYNELIEHDIAFVKELPDPIVCDTTTKLRYALHMLEGGVAKQDKIRKGKLVPAYYTLPNTEKIDYIKENWCDTKDIVIMYNYIEEQNKLKDHFKNAIILQATSYAEGIDLSMYNDLIIYSQDFSTARHTQRRARQCNMLRKEPINIHHLLVKKATSSQVYKIVAKNKKNFVDSVFERNTI